MNYTTRNPMPFLLLTILASIFAIQACTAQDHLLTKEYKEQTIQKLSQLMNDFYIHPEVAKSTETHLLKQLNDGHFNQFKNNTSFSEALTESVQSINHDKHMRIMKNRPFEAPANSPERKIEEKLDQLNNARKYNAGFQTVKMLEGNVGYLDLRGFAGMQGGKAIADAYMTLMSKADAVIIDLGKNGGGSPRMVQYLCSYFFDEKLHLNSLYYREGDRTEEFWTLDEVGGEKMPDVPLFVMTSSRTFSGAEEFSYNMQTQKRAILVGQTSGGGANPGQTMGLNENLRVFIPTGMAINPITKTSWEGTGVVPEVKTNIGESLDKAHELAKVAAQDFRNKAKGKFSEMYLSLREKLDQYVDGQSDDAIFESLKNSSEANLLYEWDINMLGYEYLMDHKKPKVARSIFKANTILFPTSGNVFDSYGEALMMLGNKKEAIKNYKKSVALDPNNENGFQMLEKLGIDKFDPKEGDLYFLKTNDSWRKELFHFPINFAPDIPYEGIEDARFPEGWEVMDSPNFWTYAFAWNVETNETLTAKELEVNLQRYFDGLMKVVNKDPKLVVPSTVAQLIRKRDNSFIGKVKLHDSFHTKKIITLNIKVDKIDCVGYSKSIIFFKFSPKDYDQPAWEKLDEVKMPEDVCSH